MRHFHQAALLAILFVCAETGEVASQESRGIWQELPPAYAASNVAFDEHGGFTLTCRGGVQSIPAFHDGCVVEGSVTFHEGTGLDGDVVRLGFFTSAQRVMKHSFEVAESPAVISFQTHHGVGKPGKITIEQWMLIDGQKPFARQLDGGRKDFQFETDVAYRFRLRVRPSKATIQFYYDGNTCHVVESEIDTSKARFGHIIIYNREGTNKSSTIDWLRVMPLPGTTGG